MSRTSGRTALTVWVLAGALGLHPGSPSELGAQEVELLGDFLFYGDNTEFYNPFRSGETLLGAHFESAVAVDLSPRLQLLAGLSGDFRSGSGEFRELEPVLSFRYRTRHTTVVLGTLIQGDRHGLIDPLAVSTLRLRRATEQGLQWLGRWSGVRGEVFLNWQRLNTRESRERFDYGVVTEVRVLPHVTALGQLHGIHEGGQLAEVADGKSNNVAMGAGLRLHGTVPWLSRASVEALALRSSGDVPDPLPGQPDRGRGAYLRTSVQPGEWFELFTIHWWGRDFVAVEGDANYGSPGLDPGFFWRDRRYTEVGLRRSVELDAGAVFRGTLRFHRVDGARGRAISGTSWEYSYRFTVDVPVRIPLGGSPEGS